MARSISRKRPWLAALLTALATGLGHCYLRRWRRALGWFAALVAVSVLFVDPATLDALLAGNSVDPLAVAPILAIGTASTVDAYLVAQVHNRVATLRAAAGGDGVLTHCPHCGREVDPDLSFCHAGNSAEAHGLSRGRKRVHSVQRPTSIELLTSL